PIQIGPRPHNYEKDNCVMKRTTLLSIAVAAVVALGAGWWWTGQNSSTSAHLAPAAGDATVETTDTASSAPAPAAASSGLIDAAKALAPRTVGDANAPVKVQEFASLSCSHCGTFYKDVYPQFKEQYIDTGKV